MVSTMSKILLFSILDNGNQLQHLAEALRKYTEHDAIHINVMQTFLDYDADVKLGTTMDYKRFRELLDKISGCDFFIFSEVLPTDLKDILDTFLVYNKINPSNTIIRTAASYKILEPEKLLHAWTHEDWMFAGPYSDWFISGRVGRVAPVDYICPVDKIPAREVSDDKIRICFSTVREEKGAPQFNNVMDKITARYDHVEKVFIYKAAWKKSVEIKSTCDITFDQFMLHHYANTAIEGMYLGHAVLSDVRSWCRMIYPDLPIISVKNERELYDSLVDLIEGDDLEAIGVKSRQYVIKHHHPSVVAKQWDRLIEHVQSEERLDGVKKRTF